jgi:hypothetical protein
MRPATTQLGVLAVVPLLLSLLALAAFIHAASSAMGAVAQRDTAAVAEAAREAETEQQRRAALEEQARELRTRLAELPAVDAQAADAERSRAELAAQRRTLDADLAAARSAADELGRAIEAKERIPATQLVPSGSRRPAAFFECDLDGLSIMPEGRRLAVDPTPADREAFLARARATRFAVFLIRPMGYKTFIAYRGVLEEHNAARSDTVDIGFEPVDGDWKLAYPAAGAEAVS